SGNLWVGVGAGWLGSGASVLESVSFGLYEGSRKTKSVGDDCFSSLGATGARFNATSCFGVSSGLEAACTGKTGVTVFASFVLCSFRTILLPLAGSSSYLYA